MIAVDTSALVAIVFGEPERAAFLRVIERSGAALLGTVSAVEARMVVHGRRGQRAVILLDELLGLPPFELVAPGADEMEAASRAFVGFGKGSGHPAALDFGDVFSSALAKVRDVPLLYKGDDFGHADVASATASHR